MTQPVSTATPARWPVNPESFWAVILRRTRYVAGIAISALIFATLGWRVAAPAPDWGGVSLVIWPSGGILAAFILALLLLLAIAICSLLVHPESPHMGLFCALLGLTGLSIRGGTVHMLVVYGERSAQMVKLLEALAIECAMWAILLLIAEIFARLLHDRFFKNIHWVTRSAPILTLPPEEAFPGASLGVAAQISSTVGTTSVHRALAIPLAMAISGVISFGLLYALMQSQAQGQVLMACFVAFFLSTLITYLLVPRIPMLPLLLVIPLTAAVGYLITAHLTAADLAAAPGAHHILIYPGHVALFIARTLPITYIASGVPGAILGYYTAFRWSLHSAEEPA